MRDFIQDAPDTYAAEPIPDEAKTAIDALLSSGDLFRYTSERAPVALLEEEFAQLLGSKYALAVSSCSAALFLSLKALDLPKGARVLIPAFTFAAVPSAVVHAECQPVLVEVDATYRIDLQDFEAKIADCDAVLISHMRGHTSDMDAIKALAFVYDVPVIEDAAHSLGTTWNGQNIGTLGHVGCFSFQSYKMINAGEGGIMVSDDPELIARAVIMSGAYEHNWKKHAIVGEIAARWQNRLPLYNLRMQNLSACVIRPQLGELERRVRDGRANHDYVAAKLLASDMFEVPAPLAPELRAPDSLQFNLRGFTDAQAEAFMAATTRRGVGTQVFGLSQDNARAFWNWQFIPGELPELPKTRAMLARACDTRLPARLTQSELDFIADAIIDAGHEVRGTDGAPNQ
ncbi:dTDP-4-amino-4,6-dideoxygalactose transaminase [Litoreibacter ponti]|uniref:dTDP-4-amino-4,6-dideoxygalactose transaminase n=1 Tax=Litoreibacter ponti TaxID=1510457 RepID=A0A2T6BK57_9RHOB|nr:aminotransferase class I/II-fold pyridoxal phosphate-dependent enzyme [Litoreibacter ponti]PTX56449.1 dTDP-4-amino-4,6-dideoxygalactose transaminase [Litoreibacter ponti]